MVKMSGLAKGMSRKHFLKSGFSEAFTFEEPNRDKE
jgi:hypothetical protein